MKLVAIVRVLAVTSVGLLAGIFFGYRMGVQYSLPVLGASAFVQLQQVIHVHYLRFMPFLDATALLTSVLWLFAVRAQWRTAEFWLVAVSAASILVIGVATATISIPLNNTLMTWSVSSPPATLRDIWAPWDRVNTLRSVLATAALLLEATALSLNWSKR
jgi:uncharacterized membrane protein